MDQMRKKPADMNSIVKAQTIIPKMLSFAVEGVALIANTEENLEKNGTSGFNKKPVFDKKNYLNI